MAGFADAIKQHQPAVYDSFNEAGTAGASWEFLFVDFEDDAGGPISLAPGYTITAQLYDATGATVLDFTPAYDAEGPGTFSLTATATQTAAIQPGQYGWRCRITETATGLVVQAWGGGAPFATFTVRPA